MTSKYLNRFAALAALLLCAAACIYPFETRISDSGEWPLVVEGDILIGDQTIVSLSHVHPFSASNNDFQSFSAVGYIEGEDGTRVESADRFSLDDATWSPSARSEAVVYFDTRTLSPGQRYRLHLTTRGQDGQVLNSYESDWLEPCPAPTIDGLNYSHHPEYDEMWVGLSMHCNGSHYFRWYFEETWEYHSDINSLFYYSLLEQKVKQYKYDEPTLYYCWDNAKSKQIQIFSTVNQTEDRFEELAFHRIGLSDKRLQILYRITVHLSAISEDAYNYWNNIKQGSEEQGSIFSPTPSEMASNVHCVSDPSVQVIGYLNLSAQATYVMYYDNLQNHFFKPGKPHLRTDKTVSVHQPDSMAYWYINGLRPFDAVYEMPELEPIAYMWTPAACIDCRMEGGSKNKPADWPNNDK